VIFWGGYAVTGIGDINDDGLPDILVGADFNNDCAAGVDCGTAYVFFGSTTLNGTKDTGSADEDVLIIGKGDGDNFGGAAGGRSNPGH